MSAHEWLDPAFRKAMKEKQKNCSHKEYDKRTNRCVYCGKKQMEKEK